jgi:hypothetical protein
MKAYSIDVEKREVKEIDIDMQANTIYTFFSSIATDEFLTIDKHTIYSDGDAISKDMPAFFIAEQLVVGNALILGKSDILDIDATIPKDELESLISYELTPFYSDALKLLRDSDINLYRVFEVTKEEEDIQLNSEWVLHVFNMADSKTKEYFLDELSKASKAKKDIFTHMQNMAILALNAMGNQ